MTDVRDDLQELFRRRADEVPPHRTVPRSLTRRAGRRIALNAVGVGLVVAALATGTFAGVRALSRPSAPQPAGQPTASVTTGPTASGTAACAAGQLRAEGSMEGAAGSREGVVTLTNASNGTCTLQGTPGIGLFDANGTAITTGVDVSTAPAGWQVDRLPEPPGWPVVTLRPGERATFRLRWSNWCPDGRAFPVWRVAMPGGGSVDVGGMDAPGAPPCNGPGQPSTIEVGPFEPAS